MVHARRGAFDKFIEACVIARGQCLTSSPKGTKAGRAPACAAYASHVLDGCVVPPRALRGTRLASLVNTVDPKLVAAAFGVNPEGVMFYLAGHVDDSHLQAFPVHGGEMIPGHG